MNLKRKIYIPLIIVAVLAFGAFYILHISKIPEIPVNDGKGIRVMSYNLRYASSDLELWNERKFLIAEQILLYQPDSIGIQEGDYEWMSEYEGLPALLVGYSYVGVGRDDGDSSGEFSAIFYLEDKFVVVDSGTFWISETPEEVSYGWDAANRRICTWATLRNIETGETYTHYNTHLDHKGKIARSEGSGLILDKVKDNPKPFVITGDFNFLQGSSVYRTILDSGLVRDSKHEAEDSMSHGTMNWFLPLNFKLLPPIDFCFISDGFEAETYRVDNSFRLGRVPVSDHFPLIVDLRYKQNINR